MFTQTVERVRHGEGCYDALGSEMRSLGYAERSLFNWRIPLHLELIAHLPAAGWGQGLLALAFPLAIGAMDPVYFFSEPWAGVVASPVGLHIFGWPKAGAGLGILALFFRELALPYVPIGVVVAWRRPGGGRRPPKCGPGVERSAPRYRTGSSSAVRASCRSPAVWGCCCSNLPVALVGFTGWRHPVSGRVLATVACYLLAFSVIGIPEICRG